MNPCTSYATYTFAGTGQAMSLTLAAAGPGVTPLNLLLKGGSADGESYTFRGPAPDGSTEMVMTWTYDRARWALRGDGKSANLRLPQLPIGECR